MPRIIDFIAGEVTGNEVTLAFSKGNLADNETSILALITNRNASNLPVYPAGYTTAITQQGDSVFDESIYAAGKFVTDAASEPATIDLSVTDSNLVRSIGGFHIAGQGALLDSGSYEIARAGNSADSSYTLPTIAAVPDGAEIIVLVTSAGDVETAETVTGGVGAFLEGGTTTPTTPNTSTSHTAWAAYSYSNPSAGDVSFGAFEWPNASTSVAMAYFVFTGTGTATIVSGIDFSPAKDGDVAPSVNLAQGASIAYKAYTQGTDTVIASGTATVGVDGEFKITDADLGTAGDVVDVLLTYSGIGIKLSSQTVANLVS